MSAPRVLPSHPSLRHLKLEAKRRLAAGEFATLHDAQAAIAREHGLPGWTALKQACVPDGHALAHVRWIIERFRDVGEPGWTPPGDDELREHFDDRFLAAIPAGQLTETITGAAADLHGELTVIRQVPIEAQVQLAGARYVAIATPEPPHRLIGLRGFALAERITDPRVKETPPVRTTGRPPPASPPSPPRPAPSSACPPCSWPAASRADRRGPPGSSPAVTPAWTGPSPENPSRLNPDTSSRYPA